MTESEWLACTDPKPMLEYLRANRKVSDRKLRLFAVACVQRYSSVDGAMREIVRVSELYADALAGWIDLASMRKLALEFQRQAMRRNVGMGAGAVRHAASVACPSAFAAAQGVLLAVVPDVAIHAIGEVFGSQVSMSEGAGFSTCSSGNNDHRSSLLFPVAPLLEMKHP